LVDLSLAKLGNTNYQVRVTRLVGGFSNPIDAEIIGNKIYVIEYGGNQGIWEVTFPPAINSSDTPLLSSTRKTAILALGLVVLGAMALKGIQPRTQG
jgi:hypothetical protein